MLGRTGCFSLLLVATLVTARDSGAQTPQGWSADAAIGAGTGHSRDYFDEGRTAARLAAAKRVLLRDKLAVYFEAGYDWLGFLEVPLACPLSSDGGCRPRFPSIAGPSVSTGLVFAPWSRLEARAGIGGGAYSVDGTLVGSAVGQFDVAAFPAAHIGLVLGTRFIVVPRYRRDRITIIPFMVGLRVR